MTKKPINRNRLSQYLRYNTMLHPPGWAWILSLAVFLGALIILIGTLLHPISGAEAPLEKRILTSIYSACGFYAFFSIVSFLILQIVKMVQRVQRLQQLHKLEADVKSILQADYKKALHRIVRKAQLDPHKLKAVKTQHSDKLEQSLFDHGELRSFLGVLTDQSLRMATPYGATPEFVAKSHQRIRGGGLFEGYFFPVRLICLFFAENELIIGDSIFDSRTGDFQTRVNRMPVSEFRGFKTQEQSELVDIDQNRLLRWLGDHRFTKEDEKQIAQTLKNYEKARTHAEIKGLPQPEPPFAFLRKQKNLIIGTSLHYKRAIPVSAEYGLVTSNQDEIGKKLSKTPGLRTKGARISTKSSSHLEYRTRWVLIRRLGLAGLIAGAAWGLSEYTPSRMPSFQVSQETIDADLLRDLSTERLTPDDQILANPLKNKLEQSEQIKFGCLNRASSVKSRPSWRVSTLANIGALTPVIFQTQSKENEAYPPGWVKIEWSENDQTQAGFIPGDRLTPLPVAGPLLCPTRVIKR